MDPSRIRLEDDRFGLISLSFRPQNRATFMGRDGDDLVWAVGIVVGDEDEIQTVEIDPHGAKSSRMLTPGELFEGLEVLANQGEQAHVIVGTLTLLGMELRASDPAAAHEFADLLRTAADNRDWRLPLHLVGQPRDLQLSAQGREILRQTASSIEKEGHARTSLSAASRLELSSQMLDTVRRRISRKSLQAYRMHGRWYVVLDNLARSRSSDLNGTSTSSVPHAPAPEPPSPFEEAPVEAEAHPQGHAGTEVALEEPFVAQEESVAPEEVVHLEEEQPVAEEVVRLEEEQPVAEEVVHLEPERIEPEADVTATAAHVEAPTEDDLAAFVAEPVEPELEPITQELPAAEASTEESESEPSLATEAIVEQEAANESLAEPDVETSDYEPPIVESAAESAASHNHVDQFISESVLDQFLVTEAEPTLATEPAPDFPEEAPEESQQEPATELVDVQAQEPSLESAAEAELETATEEAVDASLAEPSSIEDGESVVAEMTRFEASAEEAETGLTEEPVTSGAEMHQEPAEALEAIAPDVTAEAEVIEEEPSSIETEGLETISLETEPEIRFEEESATTEDQPQVEPLTSEATEPQVEAATAEESESLDEPIETSEPEERVEMADAETAESLEETGEPDVELELEEEVEPAPMMADEAEVLEEEAAPLEEPEQAEDVEIAAETATGEEAPEAESETQTEPEAGEAFGSDRVEGANVNLLMHLRDEVSFLRQQGQEKDRQIVAWINGAQWLQPFVDQIRSLEQQVERLGELQTKRDGDRISDLMSERDRLRQRLESLETEIQQARTAANTVDTNRRSWFQRMMGSN